MEGLGGGLGQILYGMDLDFPLPQYGSAGEGFSHLGWGGSSAFPALWSIRFGPPRRGGTGAFRQSKLFSTGVG